MQALLFKLYVIWYRLLGRTQVQAEFRARKALSGDRASGHETLRRERRADPRFKCVCGQLLVKGDHVCHRCGRRQLMPFAVRRVLRSMGLGRFDGTGGNLLVMALILIGYGIQIAWGSGDFLDPSTMADFYELGASIGPFTLADQPWRAFTYTMLHGGLMHVAFNSYALYIVGPMIEQRFGTARFLFAWVVSGSLAAMIPALISSSPIPVVGASGAAFGLMGMAIVEGHRSRTSQGRMIRDLMLKWVAFSTVFGLMMGGVAHGVHFAGLGVGGVCALLLPPEDRQPARKRWTPLLAIVSIALIVASLTGAALWHRAGRPMSTRVPTEVQAMWLGLLESVQGPERALGKAAAELIREGYRVAKDRRTVSETEWTSLRDRLIALVERDESVRASVIYFKVMMRLNAVPLLQADLRRAAAEAGLLERLTRNMQALGYRRVERPL